MFHNKYGSVLRNELKLNFELTFVFMYKLIEISSNILAKSYHEQNLKIRSRLIRLTTKKKHI